MRRNFIKISSLRLSRVKVVPPTEIGHTGSS